MGKVLQYYKGKTPWAVPDQHDLSFNTVNGIMFLKSKGSVTVWIHSYPYIKAFYHQRIVSPLKKRNGLVQSLSLMLSHLHIKMKISAASKDPFLLIHPPNKPVRMTDHDSRNLIRCVTNSDVFWVCFKTGFGLKVDMRNVQHQQKCVHCTGLCW